MMPMCFVGGGVRGALRGGNEYWHGWIGQDELERIGDFESRASRLDINFNRTCEGRWEEGDLSFRYDELNWGHWTCLQPFPLMNWMAVWW